MRNCSYHTDGYFNLHHLEGDVWSHTMFSYSKGMNDGVSKIVLLALLLHDIGRVFTRNVNKQKKSVHFGDFEGVSCFSALDIINKLELSELQKISILKIIMHQYTVIDFVKYDEELIKNLFAYVNVIYFGVLLIHQNKNTTI